LKAPRVLSSVLGKIDYIRERHGIFQAMAGGWRSSDCA
jgi:hypothetical protein